MVSESNPPHCLYGFTAHGHDDDCLTMNERALPSLHKEGRNVMPRILYSVMHWKDLGYFTHYIDSEVWNCYIMKSLSQFCMLIMLEMKSMESHSDSYNKLNVGDCRRGEGHINAAGIVCDSNLGWTAVFFS